MKHLIYTILFSMLFGTSTFAQTVSVPVSDHTEDQQVQGPCYMFALMAALESRALQNTDNNLIVDNENQGKVNFNEWLYYSKSVLEGSNSYTGQIMMFRSLQHFTNFDAVNFYDTGYPNGKHPAPSPGAGNFSENNSEVLNSGNQRLPWMAEFNDCPDWADNAMAYETGGLQGVGCHDVDGNPFMIIPKTTVNNNYYRFVPDTPPVDEFDNVYYSDITITAASIAQEIQNGNGVMAYFNNWQNTGWSNCELGGPTNNIVQADEHGVFIYGYDHHGGDSYTFYYKDSWPGGGSLSPGNGYYNSPESRFGSFTSNLLSSFSSPSPTGFCIRRAFILNGSVVASNPPTSTVPQCDLTISGATELSGIENYTLSGTATNVTWTVSNGLSLDQTNGQTITVSPSTCYNTNIATITANYTIGQAQCETSITVTVNPQFAIQLNGPAGGMSQVCPNSAVQLEAINVDHSTIIDYEWEVLSGANILNGQGTQYLNIQAWNTPSAFQSYRLRVKKAGCDWSDWQTMTGYIRASCGGRGGGVGIFRTGQANPKQLDFGGYFNDAKTKGNVQVEVITITGQVLLKAAATSSNPIVKFEGLPAGVVIIRMYNWETGEYEVRRQLIGQ